MMTVVAIMGGLLPIMWSTGPGSEVIQRIAVPMIGGMISSTVLTLVVIPATDGSETSGFGTCAPVAEYGREFQARAVEELDLLPDGSAIAEM